MNRLTDMQNNWNYLELVNKYPKNISRKFENDCSSKTGVITDNPFSARKWGNEQTDRHAIYMKVFEIRYKPPQNISRKFEKDSSARTEDITNNLFSVRKWGNEQTDRNTRNLKLFRTNVQTSKECLQKIKKRYLIQNWIYPKKFQ